MSNYEFKHLQFLQRMVANGDKLKNEDCEFLTGLRKELRIANEQLASIDNMMSEKEMYA